MNNKMSIFKTRKSCVNARGIPPTVVLTEGRGGVPHPRCRSRWGVPHPRSRSRWGGTPSQVQMGHPSGPGRGNSCLGLVGVTRSSRSREVPHPWLGYPHLDLAGVTPVWTWLGYPPPPRNGGQTENITSRHPSDAGGNKTLCNLDGKN